MQPNPPPSPQPIVDEAPGSLLALGVEQRVIRACLLEPVAGEHRLAGWINVQRDPTSELTQQIRVACQRLGRRLGRKLWDDGLDAPFLQSEDPVAYPPLDQVLAASSPRALLRVWVAGLSRAGGMAVAEAAVTAAPARVVGATMLTATVNGKRLADQLSGARPDVLIITGGYDDPDPATHKPVYQLSKMVASALERLPPSQYPLVIYAGDRWLAAPTADLLAAVDEILPVEVIGNVRPGPGTAVQTPLAVALTRQHRKLCQRMPGFTRLGRWITRPARIVSMETAFTQGVRAWMEVEKLPELHGVYFTSAWRLHVWAQQGAEYVRMHYAPAQVQIRALDGWPPVDLISGSPPAHFPALAPRWRDRSGMMPVIATVGQVAPNAMVQVLRQDLLEAVEV